MSQLRLTVTTPEKTQIDAAVEAVTVPLYDGEMGILPGHSPMVGRLGFGVLRYTAGGAEQSYYVDGGFVQVTPGEVAVLTDRVQDPAKIQLAAAEEELREALALASNQPALAAIKERAVGRARARRQIAMSRG